MMGNSGGDGTLTIANGGIVSFNDSGSGDGRIVLGRFGGTATLNIGTGTGAGILNAARLSTNGASGPNSGTGTINFHHSDTDYFFTKDGTSSGTGVQITQRIAVNQIGTGKTTLISDNTYTGGTTITSGTLQIGNGGTIGSITGDVLNNASLIFNRSNASSFGGVISGTGTLTKQGAGTLSLTGSNTYTGGTTITGGRLQIGNGGTTGSITGNVVNNANFAFNRSDAIGFGGIISGTGALSKFGAGTLTLTGSNSYSGGTSLSVGGLVVGHNSALGTGVLTIQAATTLGSTAPRRITNDILVNGDFAIFPGGTLVTVSAFELDGNMNLNGGNRTITNTMNFAAFEFGQVNIGGIISNGGLTFADDGYTAGENVVFFRLDGSQANTYTGDTVVGTNVSLSLGKDAGVTAVAGDVAIRNEAVLVVLNNEQIADTASVTFQGNGSLQVGVGADITETIGSLGDDGNGGASVTLENAATGSRLRVGAGSFSGTIDGGVAGGTSLEKSGTGTLTLTGTSTYAGDTAVSGGRLVVDGVHTGTGAVNVAGGAALGGSGTLAGTVTVQDGGVLAPGSSPGTLNVAGLLLNNASLLNFELATPGVSGAGVNDLVVVENDLTLDGILNIDALGGFGVGTYYLFEYGGTLTDNGLLFGVVPGAFDFAIDVGTSGQVNLAVTAAAAQYWNGPNETQVGSVTGGSGTWNNAMTNWTNATGNTASSWAGVLPAIFSGTAGTVTVAETVNVAEMRFLTDGYVLDGAGELAISGTTLTLLADADVSAEIETVITGTGGILKNGAGEVILSGSNSYEGGTQLVAGTLLVNDDFALGTGSLSLADGTTFGVKDNLVLLDNNVTVDGDVSIRAAAGLDFSGTMSLGAATRTLMFTEDLSSVCFVGPITGNGGLSLLTEDGFVVDLTMCGPESNTYTGTTTVGSGVGLLLMKDPDAVAIAGDLLIQDNAFVEVFELEESSVTQISSSSSVTIEGTGELAFLYFPLDPVYSPLEQTLAGLFGDGTLSSQAGSVNLTVLEGNFSGVITDGDPCGCGGDPLALFKSGAETLILSGSNSYRGGTTINAGTLQTDNVAALGSGPVALTGGIFEPVSALTIDSMDWSGGTLARTLDTTPELLTILNDLTVSGAGGTFDFTAGAGFLPNLTFDLLSAANLDLSMLGLFSGNTLFGLAPIFSIDGTTLEVTFAGTPIVTGAILQNSAPVGIPTFADFLVNGPVTTGTPTENNTVNGLIFNPGSSLQIFNNLTVTNGNFNVPTGSAMMTGGNVIVPGAFSKLGGGILNIFSNVFVTGPANVVGGSLLVNGTFNAPGGLTVFQNALLGGAGIINGSVLNNGIVAPGNSPGVLTINGDFVQSSSGTLQIEFGDLLRVSGNASLAGTLQYLGGSKLRYGQQITFLQAGSITGEFDEILMPDADRFRGRFLAEDGTGTLLVAPTSYTLVAETTNQRNVAKALDSYITARGDDREVVSIALDVQSEEQYPAAFDAIAPTYYESLGNIVIEQAFAQTQQMNQRLSAVRLGARGFQAIGVESPLVHDKDGKSVLEAKDAQLSTLNSELSTNWNLWAMGNGLFAKVTNVSQVPDYRFDSGGFLFGADYTFGGRDRSPNGPSTAGWDNQPYLTLGLYAGYEYTWADAGDAGNTQINSALFGGYASYSQGGFYADAILGGGYNGYQVRRSIEFSTVDRTARSQPNGGQLNTSLNLGYDWRIGKFTLGPIAGVQYTYAGIAGFTETGADSLDLRVAQQNVNSLRTTLGGRVAYTWNLTDSIALIPEVRMFWQHEFLNNPRNISSSLDGGAGPTFGYETSAPARDSVFAGAGVSAQFGDRWNAFVYYNIDFGRQDYLGNMISGGVNWKW